MAIIGRVWGAPRILLLRNIVEKNLKTCSTYSTPTQGLTLGSRFTYKCFIPPRQACYQLTESTALKIQTFTIRRQPFSKGDKNMNFRSKVLSIKGVTRNTGNHEKANNRWKVTQILSCILLKRYLTACSTKHENKKILVISSPRAMQCSNMSRCSAMARLFGQPITIS